MVRARGDARVPHDRRLTDPHHPAVRSGHPDGQRIFFLHDGRTRNLVDAILAHASHGNAQFPASEASAVIDAYKALPDTKKQDLLNFLRGL